MNKIINGDCIEELKKLPDNSIDAIITDPPYGLEFMGKDWDKFKEGKNIGGGTVEDKSIVFGRMCGKAPSFYQLKNQDMLNFQNFTFEWAKECLRVIKPGGYLLSFGGTRTYHRMTCAIEDAGFEIRDCIMWIYGSGFPKSLNIGKQIDKIQGNEREVIGVSNNEKDFRDVGKKVKEEIGMDKLSFGTIENAERKDLEITKGNSEWEGWGTALKPACEPIVVARKPLSEKNVALNVLKWGTGGININECRIEHNEELKETNRQPRKEEQTFSSESCGFKSENQTIASANPSGRFPANLILECTCDELKEGKEEISGGFGAMDIGMSDTGKGITQNYNSELSQKKEGIYKIHTNPNCPCYMLDEQSGKTSKGHFPKNNTNGSSIFNTNNLRQEEIYLNDKGGASRFFYCAKASKSERNLGCEELEDKTTDDGREVVSDRPHQRGATNRKNNHPTVKPVKLMEYLVRLVSKEGATVLDPFLGSGTTGVACAKLNRNFIGIEKDSDYVKIAESRIKPFLELPKSL